MQKIHELIKKLCPNGVEYKNIQELRLLIERDLNNCLIDEFSKATDAFS